MNKAIHVCSHFTIPKVGRECLEMLWSNGQACKSRCPLTTCYRHGMTAMMVTADNARLVRERKKQEKS